MSNRARKKQPDAIAQLNAEARANGMSYGQYRLQRRLDKQTAHLGVKWTPEMIAKLRRLYEDKECIEVIAELMGMTKNRVEAKLRELKYFAGEARR